MCFRSWDLYEFPQLQSTTKHSWAVKTTSQLEKPRYLADPHTLQTTEFVFSLWAANSSLSFKHGRGGVLAHAFYPPTVDNYSTEIHIDSAEPWHIYLTDKSASSNKDYLLNTLIHEIGHALGLMHSSREESIMFAVVTARNNNRIAKLNIEDILAIQQFYGIINPKPTTTTQPPTTEITTNAPTYVDLCTLQYVDTVLVLHHRIFVIVSTLRMVDRYKQG
ncbi:PREDICTED: matrix metalloproteinase-14-like [Trachymyrmex cornetzi]|uniref:matrix metalloproteinase-14-like n=1 Tax=Trachymyrmex cornetzi TaxID=471704 RepID=UPI00084F732C|nr:PREDICTED: matrix metalloproteinase-14-like [Trachymyrmex cornetzi]